MTNCSGSITHAYGFYVDSTELSTTGASTYLPPAHDRCSIEKFSKL